MKKNFYGVYFFITFTVTILVSKLMTMVDKLNESSFFMKDSFVLMGLYLEELVFLGVLLFISLGWLIVDLLIKRLKENDRFFKVNILYTLIILIFFIFELWLGPILMLFKVDLGFGQTYILSKLIGVFGWAWVIGAGLTIGLHRVEKKIEGVDSK